MKDIENILDRYVNIYLGVSGGRDSMCLLDYTYKNFPCIRKKLTVLFFNYLDNFCIKCEELIKEYCNQKSIKSIIGYEEGDILYSAIGAEDKWRRDRYSFFKSHINEDDCLLLGHTKKDQEVSSLISHLKNTDRCFIPPITKMDGYTLFRPLHLTDRETITKYCKENDVRYLDDPTNPQSQRGMVEECLDTLKPVIHQMEGAFKKRYSKYLEKIQEPLITYEV